MQTYNKRAADDEELLKYTLTHSLSHILVHWLNEIWYGVYSLGF